jgi:hypothetical protein
MAVNVARHRADGAVRRAAKCFCHREVLLRLDQVPAFQLAPGQQFRFVTQRYALRLRKALRARAGNQGVRRALHHLARQRDGIPHMLYRCDCTVIQRCAIHDDRIEFDFSGRVEPRASARIERRIVLQRSDSGFHGVERRSTWWIDQPICTAARQASRCRALPHRECPTRRRER